MKIYPLLLTLLVSGCDGQEPNTISNTYHLKGVITEDTFENFKYNVENFNVKKVVLDSNGGEVYPALKIGHLVDKYGIETEIPTNTLCGSSCGYIFIAGKKSHLKG